MIYGGRKTTAKAEGKGKIRKHEGEPVIKRCKKKEKKEIINSHEIEKPPSSLLLSLVTDLRRSEDLMRALQV